MVSCLSQLSQVLSQSLNMSRNSNFNAGPKSAEGNEGTPGSAFYAPVHLAPSAYDAGNLNNFTSRLVHANSRGGHGINLWGGNNHQDGNIPGQGDRGKEPALAMHESDPTDRAIHLGDTATSREDN